jgi:hypothetical protein
MSKAHIRGEQWNPWKLATLGMSVVFVTALVTGVVVASYVGQQKKSEPGESQPEQAEPQSQPAYSPAGQSQPGPAPPAPAAQHAAVRPTAPDIEACNHYASSVARDRTTETLGDALVGGALGAGLGAAGGAIAGGGRGAGKGAGIGGLVGATAGTLYGLNQGNQNDAKAAVAYRSCMRRRGYTD